MFVDSSGRYIDDQKHSFYSSYRVGLYGNVANNGCGIVAVYNVLYSYRYNINFLTVCNTLSQQNLYNTVGLGGITPGSIINYLYSKFRTVYVSSGFNINSWIRAANASGAIIVWYQNPGAFSPLHYVAGVSVGRYGKWNFYNDAYLIKNKTKNISISQYINILLTNNYKPLMIIGVSRLR